MTTETIRLLSGLRDGAEAARVGVNSAQTRNHAASCPLCAEYAAIIILAGLFSSLCSRQDNTSPPPPPGEARKESVGVNFIDHGGRDNLHGAI